MSQEYQEVETVDMKTGEVTEKRIARVEPVQEWSLSRVVDQAQKVNSLLQTVMKDGQHYGKIPGCGDKPTLLKPGAEKLGVMFRLAPRYKIESRDLSNGHREYEVTCSLYHIHTQEFWGEGVGVCSTMESKYRYRSKQRVCPECGKETIIKGKEEFGGGWLCYKKKGGCGAKWNDGDTAIEKQSVGKTENPDIADTYNTVKKMAKKRALVDATITATGASDIFTQDIEDFAENEEYSGNGRNQQQPPKTPAGGAQAGRTSTQTADKGNGKVITEKQLTRMFAIANQSGVDKDTAKAVLGVFGYESSKDVLMGDYDKIINVLQVPSITLAAELENKRKAKWAAVDADLGKSIDEWLAEEKKLQSPDEIENIEQIARKLLAELEKLEVSNKPE